MQKVNLPNSKNGDWEISKFEVKKLDYRSLFVGRHVPKGEYTKLTRNGQLIMSDTPAEMTDHHIALKKAKGTCLINGLGLGMLLKNILLKDEVTEVIVIEISNKLIELIGTYFENDHRVKIINADAFKYIPEKNKKFDMVWHDIWDSICGDNLPEMKRLHRKYYGKAKWQGSWCKKECSLNARGF
jgi:predicted membrane-bound spermidine synthase